MERQITSNPQGHVLTNTGVWSPDGQWIVYDTRSDATGAVFDGQTIEMVHVGTGEVRVLYRAQHGACCGVATFHPRRNVVAFILGPEHPTAEWQYGPTHRRGVIVDVERPGETANLDARDISPPFTPGALRGGSHVHVFSGDGRWVSFTYEDHVLAEGSEASEASSAPLVARDLNQRNVGVAVGGRPVIVPGTHPRNHSGEYFSVVVTSTVNSPRPGSDEIGRAYEDAWVGTAGYRRVDGKMQERALALLGDTIGVNGDVLTELFIVDLPGDLTRAGAAPLEGTESRRPAPPAGVVQRRLTHTAHRSFPGVQGPRHWPRSSPDGTAIAFLMRDDDGAAQLWVVSPTGGDSKQITRGQHSVASAFSWHPEGTHIAYVADDSVWGVDVRTLHAERLTRRGREEYGPRAEACVFSPDGQQIAYVRPVFAGGEVRNQIFVTPF